MKTVLIVDDNPNVRNALRAFLRYSNDMQVCGEAANGAEAIKTAEAIKPDLILMDLLMPKMNGAEAASVLRKMMPQSRIVIFTLYSEAMGKTIAKACGFDLVLSKADGAELLAAALQTLWTDAPSDRVTISPIRN